MKLETLPIFSNLPANVVTRILKHAVTKEFKAGEMIVREGEPGQEFFLLLSGTVEFLAHNGQSKLASGEGTAFGEIALIERVKRTASVRAHDTVTVVVLQKKFFDLLFLPGSDERKTLTENIRRMMDAPH